MLQHRSASRSNPLACFFGHGQLPADASSTRCTAFAFTTSRTRSATSTMLTSTCPVSILRITTPNENTSDSVVSSPVAKNTGSMYPGVPIGFVSRQMVSSSSGFTCTTLAVPKSPSRLTLQASRRMLLSFTSPWMMAWGRLQWRYARAERCSARILTRSSHERPLEESPSNSVPLGRYSYTRPHDSGHTPISLTMCRCLVLLSTATCKFQKQDAPICKFPLEYIYFRLPGRRKKVQLPNLTGSNQH